MKTVEQQKREYEEKRAKEILERGFRTSLERYASADEVRLLKSHIQVLESRVAEAERNSTISRMKRSVRKLLQTVADKL